MVTSTGLSPVSSKFMLVPVDQKLAAAIMLGKEIVLFCNNVGVSKIPVKISLLDVLTIVHSGI